VRFGGPAAAVAVGALRASRVEPGKAPTAPGGVELAAIAPWRNDLTRGLVGWWKFDEGSGTEARDSSGCGNHGTIVGADRVAGKSGGALRFAGGNQWVDVGNGPTLRLAERVTVATWIRFLAPEGTNSWRCIIGQAQPNRNYNVYYYSAPDLSGGIPYPRHLRLTHRLPETAPAWDDPQMVLSAGGVRDILGDGSKHILTAAPYPPDSASWHHVVGITDIADGGSHRFYIDGELAAEYRNLGFGRLVPSRANFRIGWGSPDYAACLDDVRVYGRALSAEEVRRLAGESGR
jgi:hypothetical protein